ncbi:MAG: nucleotidyl transferase AbiEii/AbiGii toxin family protein [Serpentinimonas sp.]|nr:nucleotidyl transferase AbiEii/AbiGii toxin family protein [Serpentinimonas sp.]MDO9610848.1 nucleotidyl transferase AbiEii/AbiGii toxin family protein [Serpentinimonas sp.]
MKSSLKKRSALSPAQHLQWSELAHAHFLGALMRAAKWQAGELAFHGGTNLHLCWQSSRYSEDLDFLLCSSRNHMRATIDRAAKEVLQNFQAIDPAFQIELRDKTKNPQRMITQHLVVKHPQVMGQVMVKLEFWRVDPLYMANYPTELRTPLGPGDYRASIRSPVPSATKACAFADKLVAFSTRPHLKWRDLYDLWWIGTQSQVNLDMAAVTRQYLHNLQAYETAGGLPAHKAVLHLIEKYTDAELVAAADPDLKNWLPQALWEQFQGHGLREIVSYVRHTLRQYSERISQTLNAPGRPP